MIDIVDWKEADEHAAAEEAQRAAAYGTKVKMANHFSVETIVHLAMLSRIAELMRFTCEPSVLNEVVTKEALKNELKNVEIHHMTKQKKTTVTFTDGNHHPEVNHRESHAQVDEKEEEDLDAQQQGALFAAIEERIDEIWATFEDLRNRHHIRGESEQQQKGTNSSSDDHNVFQAFQKRSSLWVDVAPSQEGGAVSKKGNSFEGDNQDADAANEEKELFASPWKESSAFPQEDEDDKSRTGPTAPPAMANKDSTTEKKREEEKEADNSDAELLSDLHHVRTFNDLLDYQFPLFPEISKEDRHTLHKLAQTRLAVSQTDVCQALNCSPDAQVISFIFASGAKVLSSEVLKTIVATLWMSPRAVSFAPEYIAHRVDASRRMTSLVPNIILFILISIYAPQVARIAQHTFAMGLGQRIDDEWRTGCFSLQGKEASSWLPFLSDASLTDFSVLGGTNFTNGTAAASQQQRMLGCEFWKRHLDGIRYPTYDVLRYIKSELIYLLWPADGGSAVSQPFASAWLLGALSIRHVIADDSFHLSSTSTSPMMDGTNSLETLCRKANVTTSAQHLSIGHSYGCRSRWQAVIPFSLNRIDALELVRSPLYNLSQVDLVTTALVIEFFGVELATGIIGHAQIILSLPRGGTAIPRFEITPIDPQAPTALVPVFIAQVVVAVVVLFTTLLGAIYGLGVAGMGPEIVRTMVTTALVSASYYYFLQAADVSGGLDASTEYVIKGIDERAYAFNVAMSYFGFYVMFVVLTLGRFLQDIPGLQLVVLVLYETWVEMASLAFVFIVWATGFLAVGLSLFGGTIPDFVNFPRAAITIVSFWFGTPPMRELEANHPISGPIYFFVSQICVVYFALNLLIAVITTPITSQDKTSIKRRIGGNAELLNEIERNVVAIRHGNTLRVHYGWMLYSRFFLPMLLTVRDALTGVGIDIYWSKLHQGMQVLYPDTGINDPSTLQTLDACLEMLRLSKGCDEKIAAWNSSFLRDVLQEERIQRKVSLALVLLAICGESNSSSLWDARLMESVFLFKNWKDNIFQIIDIQDLLAKEAQERTAFLEIQMEKSKKCANQWYETADPKLIYSIADGAEELEREKPATPTVSSSLAVSNAVGEAASGHIGDQYDEFLGEDLSAAPTTAEEEQVDFESVSMRKAVDRVMMVQRVEDYLKRKKVTAYDHKVALQHVMSAKHHFSDNLDAAISTSWINPLRGILSLTLAVYFLLPFTQVDNSTAYLVQSANEGLRDMPFLGRCSNASCYAAQSYEKKFTDIDGLSDTLDWIQFVVGPQMFRSGSGDGDSFRHQTLVAWDARIQRHGAIKVRQLRGKLSECHTFPISSPSAFHNRIQGERCYNSDDWSRTDMAIPPQDSLKDPAAYTFHPECVAELLNPFLGILRTYPCSGYVAHLNSTADLDEFLNSNWLDNGTRLVSFHVQLKLGDAFIEQVLVVELGDGGQGARTRTLGFPLSEVEIIAATSIHRFVFHFVLGIHLFLYCIFVCRHLYLMVFADESRKSALQGFPEFPFLAFVAALVTYPVAYLAVDYVPDQAIIQNICAVVYIQRELFKYFLFPVASLASKQVKVLFDTLTDAMEQCMFVVPFLLIAYTAFAYSGHVLFSRSNETFAQLRTSLVALVLGTFGEWDISAVQHERPLEAQIFSLFFFIVVLIVLANLFLAMVTSAADDAQQTAPAISVAENVQYYYARQPLFGDFVNALLAISMKWVDALTTSDCLRRYVPAMLQRRRQQDPAILTPWGRLWLPVECLVPLTSPLDITRVLRRFHHLELNQIASGALIPFVITEHLNFKATQRLKYFADKQSSTNIMVGFAKYLALAHLQQRALDERNHKRAVEAARTAAAQSTLLMRRRLPPLQRSAKSIEPSLLNNEKVEQGNLESEI